MTISSASATSRKHESLIHKAPQEDSIVLYTNNPLVEEALKRCYDSSMITVNLRDGSNDFLNIGPSGPQFVFRLPLARNNQVSKPSEETCSWIAINTTNILPPSSFLGQIYHCLICVTHAATNEGFSDKEYHDTNPLTLTMEQIASAHKLVYIGFDTYFNKYSQWITRENRIIELSSKQAELLQFFVLNAGRVVNCNDIASELWNGYIEGDSVRKLIRRLRNKLGVQGKKIIRGRRQGGYIFESVRDI